MKPILHCDITVMTIKHIYSATNTNMHNSNETLQETVMTRMSQYL